MACGRPNGLSLAWYLSAGRAPVGRASKGNPIIVTFQALQAAVDLLNTPMTILDLGGRVRHLNPANLRLLGRRADELLGQPIEVILPPELRDRNAGLLASLLERRSLHAVFPVLKPDGAIVEVEVSAEVVRGLDGEPHFIAAEVRDLGPQLAQLTELSHSALQLVAEPDDNLLTTIVRAARGLLGARYAALGVVEEGRLVRFIPDGMADAEIAGIEHLPDGHGLLGAMITEQRTMRVNEIGADPRSTGFPSGHPPMRSFLGTPILTADAVLGHLYFTDKWDGFEFNLIDERLAELFASHAAVAIRDQRRREALERSEHNLAEAQRIAHLGSWERNLVTGALRWSVESHRIFGVEPGTFAGTVEAFVAFVHPEDRDKAAPSLDDLAAGDRRAVEYRIIRADGAVRTLHEEAVVIRDATGTPIQYVGTTQDFTDRAAAEQERAKLAAAIEQTAEAVVVTEPDGTISYVNPSFERLTGYRADELLGQNPRLLKSGRHDPVFFANLWTTISSGRAWSDTLVDRRKDGTLVEFESVISPVHDANGRLVNYIQTGRDVTRERDLEDALARDARERETIEAALERIDSTASAEEIAAAACAEIARLPGIDVTWVNVFEQASGRILAAEGSAPVTIRPGLPVSEGRVRHLRERASSGPWIEAWEPRPEFGAFGEAMTATGLRGLAFAPLKGAHGVLGVIGIGARDRADGERLIERLPALTTFGAIVGALVAPGIEASHREADARATIAATIAAGAFTPFFQPIADLHSGAIVGYEALTRFADGTPPDVMFGLADRAGIGLELETATLAAALDAAAVLPARAYLSLNVSPALIVSGDLAPLLAGSGRTIALEITEHVLVEDYAELRAALTALGPDVRLAVDDAGAGYASLRHILELAPNYVKLDLGLVRGIDTDPARQALIAGMTYFAVKRKVRLVAEGIETTAELETLRELAIPYGQGYLLGRPQDGRGPGPWPATIALPGHR